MFPACWLTNGNSCPAKWTARLKDPFGLALGAEIKWQASHKLDKGEQAAAQCEPTVARRQLVAPLASHLFQSTSSVFESIKKSPPSSRCRPATRAHWKLAGRKWTTHRDTRTRRDSRGRRQGTRKLAAKAHQKSLLDGGHICRPFCRLAGSSWGSSDARAAQQTCIGRQQTLQSCWKTFASSNGAKLFSAAILITRHRCWLDGWREKVAQVDHQKIALCNNTGQEFA